MLADFEDYLNEFSPNVQDILENFKFRNQLTRLSRADGIGMQKLVRKLIARPQATPQQISGLSKLLFVSTPE